MKERINENKVKDQTEENFWSEERLIYIDLVYSKINKKT